jgi:hypothetical protein
MTIDRAPRPDINPDGVWIAGGGWSSHTDITLANESLYNSDGGGSFEYRGEASGYDSETRTFAKALAGNVSQAISINFGSRLSRD